MAETIESLNRYVANSTFRELLMTGLVEDAIAEHPQILDQHPNLAGSLGRYASGLETLGEWYGRGCEEVYDELDGLSEEFFGDGAARSEGSLDVAGLAMVVIVPEGLTVYEDIKTDETYGDDTQTHYAGGTRYGGYAYVISGQAPRDIFVHALKTEAGLLIRLADIGEAIARPYIIRCKEAAKLILARRELAECFDDDHIKAFRVHPSRYKIRDGVCGSCTRDNCRHNYFDS